MSRTPPQPTQPASKKLLLGDPHRLVLATPHIRHREAVLLPRRILRLRHEGNRSLREKVRDALFDERRRADLIVQRGGRIPDVAESAVDGNPVRATGHFRRDERLALFGDEGGDEDDPEEAAEGVGADGFLRQVRERVAAGDAAVAVAEEEDVLAGFEFGADGVVEEGDVSGVAVCGRRSAGAALLGDQDAGDLGVLDEGGAEGFVVPGLVESSVGDYDGDGAVVRKGFCWRGVGLRG